MSNVTTYERQGGGGRAALLFILGALAIGFIVLGLVMASAGSAPDTRPVSKLGVILNTHATDKHPEASAIRKCLDDGGLRFTMKARRTDTYYLACMFDKDAWGLQAVEKNGEENTAFSPGKLGRATLRELQDYFGNWATPFKGNLPWQ